MEVGFVISGKDFINCSRPFVVQIRRREDSPRPQDAQHFCDRRTAIRQMMQRVKRKDRVEGLVFERQSKGVRTHEADAVS